MGRPARQTFAKRMREKKRDEKRKEKEEKKRQRAIEKEADPSAPGDDIVDVSEINPFLAAPPEEAETEDKEESTTDSNASS